MSLRDIETSLPPGFRFFPNDEELVCHYLHKKSSNEKISNVKMVEVNLHICEPWQLPDVAKLDDNVWYFFSFRDRKYATGFRSNRTTTAGFWKATGKDRPIYDSGTNLIVGMRKTLVFYIGRAPNGAKTDWIMHEFRVENAHMPPKEEWVLCRVIHKGNREFTTKGGLDNYYNDKMANSSNLLPLGDELTPIGSKMVPQCSYNQHNGVITLPSLAPFDATSLQFPQREWCVSNSETGSRIEDKLMFDMISENDVLGIGEAATFDMMRF